MRRVDPHTGNHAGSHRERELLPRRHRRVHPAPGDEHETDVLEGQEQIRAPAVETILLQFRDRFVRWAVTVLARQEIDQGNDDDDQPRPDGPEEPETEFVDQEPRSERAERNQQTQWPQVALLVSPHRPLPVPRLPCRCPGGFREGRHVSPRFCAIHSIAPSASIQLSVTLLLSVTFQGIWSVTGRDSKPYGELSQPGQIRHNARRIRGEASPGS